MGKNIEARKENTTLQVQLDQLKQTLAEIKEVAKNRSNYPCGKCIKTEILQKISEVEKWIY